MPFLKLRAFTSPERALRLSLGTVLGALVLPSADAAVRRTGDAFLLSLVSSALAFFLFSFQVHEKHILLPLLPATVYFPQQPLLVGWFSVVACFSMFPLLQRDGLTPPYFAVIILSSVACVAVHRGQRTSQAAAGSPVRLLEAACALSLAGMSVLHLLELFMEPPVRYPHLFAYLFCAFSFVHFLGAFIALQGLHLRLALRQMRARASSTKLK